ncbi:hypothetical protein REPUB_Repub12eG0199600 [Reevesia pubescens]
MEWLVLRVETLQNLTLFTVAFFLLLPKSQVTPGLVGLSLSYALSLTGTQIFASRWAVAYIPLTVLVVPASVLTLGGGYLFGLLVRFIADSISATGGAGNERHINR